MYTKEEQLEIFHNELKQYQATYKLAERAFNRSESSKYEIWKRKTIRHIQRLDIMSELLGFDWRFYA